MATAHREVRLDRSHFDDVVLAVAALDSFTGTIVADGIEVHLEKNLGGVWRRFPIKPVRNASGHHVFVNRRNQGPLGSPPTLPALPYRIAIEAEDAGYFDPPTIPVIALPNDKRLTVMLHRRPGLPLVAGVTSIDGVVVNAAGRVGGALIRAVFPANVLPPNAQPNPFETLSDNRGSFSLRLRLPTRSVNTRFEFSRNTPALVLNKTVIEGRHYAFDGLIDLRVNAPNINPPLIETAP